MTKIDGVFKSLVITLLGTILSATLGAVLWLARIDHDYIKSKAESAYEVGTDNRFLAIKLAGRIDILEQDFKDGKENRATILKNQMIIMENEAKILRLLGKYHD